MRVKLLTKFHSSQILLNAPVLIESVEYQFTFFPKLAQKRSWAVLALSLLPMSRSRFPY